MWDCKYHFRWNFFNTYCRSCGCLMYITSIRSESGRRSGKKSWKTKVNLCGSIWVFKWKIPNNNKMVRVGIKRSVIPKICSFSTSSSLLAFSIARNFHLIFLILSEGYVNKSSGCQCSLSQYLYLAEILSGKNVRAWVSIVFTWN